jgi:DNA-binding transcriptional regulator GbsR (MarR family)
VAPTTLAEVRYSLPQLLEELKLERTASSFAMEKLDQAEIGKLFKSKGPRRAKSQK